MSQTNPKIAVVTGAARGIGLAAAQGLITTGHRVLLCDIDADELGNAVNQLPAAQTAAFVIDMSDEEAAIRVDAETRRLWGPASVLVNNAAISPKYNGRALDILSMTLPEWERILRVNLTAAMLMCHQFLPAMKEAGWGRIINVSSSGGRTRGMGPAGPAYMASKAALLGLTRHIASELGPFGVTANVVAPGRVETRMGVGAGSNAIAEWAKMVPVGRLGQPDEVAAAIELLASERAGFINGAVIDVNGGMFML